jgi:site-specific DNA-cytosine methylase
MSAYYNEIDPYAAEWLRNLIDAGEIPAGVVDTRSIEDVRPDELAGFTQCHFFAGLGGWAYALKLAGWGTRPVWTGSCPCQPFSAAGKGAGFADERHLWPAWQHLIAQCRPSVIFGEQVDAAVKNGWWDLVASDAEAMGYAAAAAVIPASAAGAPHMRHRLWFVLSLGATTKRELEHRNDGKNLHEMPTEKTDHTLLQREEIQGRTADGLQGVLRDPSEETAKSNEPKGEGPKNCRASDKARRSGARLLEEEAAEISSQRTDQACEPPSKKEGFGVRPGSARIGAIRAGGEECLRDDRDCASKRRAEGMEHPVLGSNKPGEGLRLQQCESGLLRPELRDGDVGGRSADGNITSPEKEVGINDSEHALQAHDKDKKNSGGKIRDVYSGVGAPHIRDRTYWVADSNDARLEGWGALRERPDQCAAGARGVASRLADADSHRCCARERDDSSARHGHTAAATRIDAEVVGRGFSEAGARRDKPAGPTNGQWADADWLGCTDGKWRPTQSTHECMADGLADSLGYVRTGDAWSLNPLIQGAKNRVGRLRAYGNAICAPAAEAFIRSYLDASHG